MRNDTAWKREHALRTAAESRGEEVSMSYGENQAPIDPLRIARAERSLIHVEGADFGNAFDGRLSFVGPRFLLCYNTRYNSWPHAGDLHPKVRFTIAHELGHYFIDQHREYLVKSGGPHGSHTEFESDSQVERQADSFAAGLLMPKQLVSPCVNQQTTATLSAIRALATEFQVSLTAMAVRWTQVSHFPCATLCVRCGNIQWGFVSSGFKDAGLFRARRNMPVVSKDANSFVGEDPTVERFRLGDGTGYAHHWIDSDGGRISVAEHYMAIPYSESVLVFLSAEEDDLPEQWDD